MNCSGCGRSFLTEECRASISGSIMGDECTESYYYCALCGVYTKEVYFDCFSGRESSSACGPIEKETGDLKVALIKGCAEPWDKKCRCAAHRSYFEGSLD